MLYKNQDILFEKLFQNPPSEYRATPFWAWNCKLDREDLLFQIDTFKKMGYGGFHMHVRTGMEDVYLGKEHMEKMKDCVEKAREEKMLAWLYDEDRWPSGAAGGYVTKNHEFRARYLRLTRKKDETQTPYAVYDVLLDDEGKLSEYKKAENGQEFKGFGLYAYLETEKESPWFNNETYVNTLDEKAIAEFINVTHEKYREWFSKDFGSIIPAIFTDEPQFTHKQALAFSHEDKDISLPWSSDLDVSFAEAYNGAEIPLPELLWEKSDGVSEARYRYHDHIAERFAVSFADQIGEWCEKNGIMLTGHMMMERSLCSQTAALGDTMRSYRAFQLPGIDILCDHHEFTTAKQAQSAARQYGRPGVLSELYGVTNWDYDFRGHKLQGDWQAAMGVTVRVPHLSWVSMKGEAKRDYPATFNYQIPWHDKYAYIEDHFARVNTAMTRGKPSVRIGVIHPVESYWLYWGVGEHTLDIREQMDENFENLTNWLVRGLIDFDFISESLLPEQCGEINSVFSVGKMDYDVIIVPAMETIRSTTLDKLEEFQSKGGRIIFLGTAPKYENACPSERGKKLYSLCEAIGFERQGLMEALEGYREVDIRDRDGQRTNGFTYQYREDGNDRYLFIAHTDNPENPDLIFGEDLRISVRGEYDVILCDTLNGNIMPIEASIFNGFTIIRRKLFEHDSLLLKLIPANISAVSVLIDSAEQKDYKEISFKNTGITLHEPNVLLLDMAEFSLDGGEWRECEEILRIDNTLRKELNMPLKGSRIVQPWVENDKSTPYTLRLRYTFNSDITVKGALIALENAEITGINLNEENISDNIQGYYVDKCIKTIALPDIKAGINTLILTIPYGKKSDLERVYILGDFGVTAIGRECFITKPIRRLAFGDITRQGLPFYGGNITYHMKADVKGDSLTIEASYYRGALLSVLVDNKEAGELVYSPYTLTINGLEPGEHQIDIVLYGTRINTFGQLHYNARNELWYGPDSWRTKGVRWTYEYRFWEQGIMKSPNLYENK